jgi:hypothetical protein
MIQGKGLAKLRAKSDLNMQQCAKKILSVKKKPILCCNQN